ncbi:hypothetical protein TNCV_824531 [Trichonephila clavipes]|nr:hypothetical protein TNCV_824531 [Trichonephila clavipes]
MKQPTSRHTRMKQPTSRHTRMKQPTSRHTRMKQPTSRHIRMTKSTSRRIQSDATAHTLLHKYGIVRSPIRRITAREVVWWWYPYKPIMASMQ